MSWFTADAISSLASKVQTLAENALVASDDLLNDTPEHKPSSRENTKTQSSHEELLTRKLQEASTFIKQLTLENSTLSQKCDQQEIQIAQLSQNSPNLISQNKSLSESLEKAKRHAHIITNEIEIKDSEILELNTLIENITKQKDDEIAHLNSQIIQLQNITSNNITSDDDNTRILQELQNENLQLKNSLHQYEQETFKHSQNYDALDELHKQQIINLTNEYQKKIHENLILSQEKLDEANQTILLLKTEINQKTFKNNNSSEGWETEDIFDSQNTLEYSVSTCLQDIQNILYGISVDKSNIPVKYHESLLNIENINTEFNNQIKSINLKCEDFSSLNKKLQDERKNLYTENEIKNEYQKLEISQKQIIDLTVNYEKSIDQAKIQFENEKQILNNEIIDLKSRLQEINNRNEVKKPEPENDGWGNDDLEFEDDNESSHKQENISWLIDALNNLFSDSFNQSIIPEKYQEYFSSFKNDYLLLEKKIKSLNIHIREKDTEIERLLKDFDTQKDKLEEACNFKTVKITESFELFKTDTQKEKCLSDKLLEDTKEILSILQVNFSKAQKEIEESHKENTNLLLRLKEKEDAQSDINHAVSEKMESEVKTLESIVTLENSLRQKENELSLLRNTVTTFAAKLKDSSDKEEFLLIDIVFHCILEFMESAEIDLTVISKCITINSQTASEIQNLNNQIIELQNENESLNTIIYDFKTRNSQILSENQTLQEENTLLEKSLSTLKGAVTERLQAKADENELLKSEIEALKLNAEKLGEIIKGLESEISSKESNGNISLQELSLMQAEKDGHIDSISKLNREIERLRAHLMESENNHSQEILDLENVIEGLKHNISELSQEHNIWEEAIQVERETIVNNQRKIDELKQDMNELRRENDILIQKSKEDTKCISSLQNVLEKFQNTKESEIQLELSSMNKKVEELTQKASDFEARALLAEEKLSNIGFSEDSVKELKEELTSKTAALGRLRHDIAQLQSHLSEAMKRLKHGSEEDSVDRKVISNLLVQFMSFPHGDSRKFEILGVLSGILKLDHNEQVKMGLIRGESKAQAQKAAESSFTDMWIAFLFKEAGVMEGPKEPVGSPKVIRRPSNAIKPGDV